MIMKTMKCLLTAGVFFSFLGYSNAATIVSQHTNNTQNTVALGVIDVLDWWGGNARGNNTIPSKSTGLFILDITGTSYGFVYNYSNQGWPFDYCGLYTEGSKDPVTGYYSLSYYVRGKQKDCKAEVGFVNQVTGEFLFNVTQNGWFEWYSN